MAKSRINKGDSMKKLRLLIGCEVLLCLLCIVSSLLLHAEHSEKAELHEVNASVFRADYGNWKSHADATDLVITEDDALAIAQLALKSTWGDAGQQLLSRCVYRIDILPSDAAYAIYFWQPDVLGGDAIVMISRDNGAVLAMWSVDDEG